MVNIGRGEEHPFLGRELSTPKRYSEEMAWPDHEIRKMKRQRSAGLFFDFKTDLKIIIPTIASAGIIVK